MGNGTENVTSPDGESAEPTSEIRRFGMATATFVVIASMVGTGVLTTSGYTVYYTGSNQLMLALWVVGGVVAICGALTLCELSAALPRSGGDYVFLYEAYGPLPAFLSGWVSFLIGFGGPIAASGFAAAKYLLSPLELDDVDVVLAQRAFATLAIVVLGIVHSRGHSGSIRVQGATTIIKLSILGLLAAAGVTVGWKHWEHLSDRPPVDADLVVTMGFSFVYIAYAYTGWSGVAYIAGEVERPQRRLPMAILLGTGVVLVLYLALNMFYALALSADDVRSIVEDSSNLLPDKTDAVAPIAQLAASRLFGERIARPMSVAIGLTLLASLSAFILTGPRVAYAMARAGQFPPIAGRLSRSGTPAVATGLQIGWALVLLWTGSFENILVYSGVGLSLFSMLTVSAVYVLRWRRPELPRPFRTPGYPVVPALFLAVTGGLVVAVFVQPDPRQRTAALISVLSILAGIPVYFLWTFWTGRGNR